jgi:pyruvate-formate lyase-activating enzyme
MCNLRCVFCQNHDIAHQRNGQDLSPEELGDWYVSRPFSDLFVLASRPCAFLGAAVQTRRLTMPEQVPQAAGGGQCPQYQPRHP